MDNNNTTTTNNNKISNNIITNNHKTKIITTQHHPKIGTYTHTHLKLDKTQVNKSTYQVNTKRGRKIARTTKGGGVWRDLAAGPNEEQG